MEVFLTPKQEQLINQLIASGLANSKSDAIAKGLRLLEDRYFVSQMRLAELQKEIDIGIEQLERRKKVDSETAINKLKQDIINRSQQ
ncbi:ribbon-helix-helix domain-containing protein [Oscillatoria salina]|uniref:ribbon-helix-helix domain-containing protein n=1 Tax=Oscillatoria salina TaxID=331517 RepID=UPI001CCD5B00|nr:type II toxin-antitoxin system ParD family antitoxin [Oscillatoria salina]MBZ8180099.1 type II toxin-antitoxin system ParD family antitoxin [Oscillatoria salina IIICB1]